VAHWMARRLPTRKSLPMLYKPKRTPSYTFIPDQREFGISGPTGTEHVSIAIMFWYCIREVPDWNSAQVTDFSELVPLLYSTASPAEC
jgi:hypothetical protein